MAPRDTKTKPDELVVQVGLGVVVLVLIVLAGSILNLHWSLSFLGQSYEQNSAQIEAEANQTIEQRCALLSGWNKEECVAEATKSAQQEQRDEADLYAQRKMAEWAFGVGVTAFISAFLSLVGIFFIWRSLALNRAAVDAAVASNKVARDIGQAQVRAYLTCRGAVVEFQNDCLILKPTIRNSGQSPAKEITFRGSVTVYFAVKATDGSVQASMSHSENGFGDCEFVAAQMETEGHVVWLHTAFTKEAFAALRAKKKFHVGVRMSWVDVFDGHHESTFILQDYEPEVMLTTRSGDRITNASKGMMRAYNQKFYEHPDRKNT